MCIASLIMPQCVYPEIYSNNGKEKNTVLDRLLDQRRRYHESVTLPLVLAWLRFSGFVGYDGSKSLKKQNAEVFESAADALEGDEHGACAYYDGAMYGKSYQASCLALRSASETFSENALGYVKKLIVDDEKLTNTVLKFESDITSSSDLNNQERNNMSTSGFGSTEYYPHQLAFVFAKVRIYRTLHEKQCFSLTRLFFFLTL